MAMIVKVHGIQIAEGIIAHDALVYYATESPRVRRRAVALLAAEGRLGGIVPSPWAWLDRVRRDRTAPFLTATGPMSAERLAYFATRIPMICDEIVAALLKSGHLEPAGGLPWWRRIFDRGPKALQKAEG